MKNGGGHNAKKIYRAENKPASDSTWTFDEGKGSFSILVLRKIVNGSVKNFVLNCDVHTENTDPSSSNWRIRYIYSIIGFADLNGDGKMEIISSGQYYEGKFYEIFEVNKDSAKSVLVRGMGE